MIPRHVQDQLIADGLMDHRRLTHNARPARCPRCHAPTIAGIDDLGGSTHVQPDPTTRVGELAALLTGRRLWTVLAGRLVHRGADRITHRDPDTEPSHPEHHCPSPPLPANPTHTAKTYRPDYTAEPPY